MTREEARQLVADLREQAIVPEAKIQSLSDSLEGLSDEALSEYRDSTIRIAIAEILDGTVAPHIDVEKGILRPRELAELYFSSEPVSYYESGILQLSELVGLNTSPGSEWDEVGDYREDFQSEWGEDDDPTPDDYIP